MIERNTIKKLIFAAVAALLVAVSVYCLQREKSECMGVPIISQQKAERFTQFTEQDFNGRILHMDMPVAIDNASRTIYISQNIDETTLYTELDGMLVALENQPMYFVRDEGFDNFSDAVRNGHGFRLIIDTGNGTYMEYNVVFTNLPVIRMVGEKTGVNEENRSIYSGDIIVWDGLYEGTGKYRTVQSNLEWHRRGASTLGDDKKSWKLSLKNEDGTNNDLDFVGLEEGDDDWILNAIYRDDTKVREKMTMDMWNQLCEDAPYNYKMSTGRYVEVVNNGQYCGLYLLQRRLDGKYLELDDEVMFKGIKATEGLPIEFFYDIVYPKTEKTEREHPDIDNLSAEEKAAYSLIEPLHINNDVRNIAMDNWADVSLMIDLGYMPDNAGRKNIYYIIEKDGESTKIKQLLWDTDFSFGVSYNKGFVHEPEGATDRRRYRREDVYLKEYYSNFDEIMAKRWFELRETVFTQENIFDQIRKNTERINICGAFERDRQLWGNYYEGGTDTVETLYSYVEQRLVFLDECYGESLG